MKFNKITLNNFRQYYGHNVVDLETNNTSNIVIIGGKNGYGKTNFLISIVWCLYGENLSQIDDNFKKEIQKEKNYSSFMQQSINKVAKNENNNNFSVELLISDVEFDQVNDGFLKSNDIIIKRTFDVYSMYETLSITDSENMKELFDNDTDKAQFINDYIIPIDAAKFVFFDAEKIAEIANLSIKEEGSFMNDALGKILGLDIYETLIDDLYSYVNSIKKEGASKNIQEAIINTEKTIDIYKERIQDNDEDIANRLKEIDELKKQIREYNEVIAKHSKSGSSYFDRDEINNQIFKLKEEELILNEKFNELSELIPLAILTGQIEEIIEHIKKQDSNISSKLLQLDNSKKIDDFIENLFNKPPEPEDSTFTLVDKLFYYQKAKSLSEQLFKSEFEEYDLHFEHDLSNADKRIIEDAHLVIGAHSKEAIENVIYEHNSVKLKIDDLNKKLRRIEVDLDDDLIFEYASRKDIAEYSITEKNRQIGELNQSSHKLHEDIIKLEQQLITLLKKGDINQRNKIKVSKAEEYINVLHLFLDEFKSKHKVNIEKTILHELKILLHKLTSNNQSPSFINNVNVSILPSGQGMLITLLDQYDNEIKKETLASGEKQIYISCLIKAILKESIFSLPIFIDTPLGRLDEEHRDNMTKLYYPNLSEQVVLFSTNSEITPKRFKEIEGFISKSYILVNDGSNTKVEMGYFKNLYND